MAHYPILAVALAILGAEAGPCRPTSVTSLAEPSSTIASDTTITTLATIVPTTLAETTSNVSEETTSTDLAETTTTTEAPTCVETQVVINPGFDLSDSNKSPWFGDGLLINDGANSAPNAISFIFENGQGNAQISQTLSSLEGTYRLSYQWGVFSGVNVGAGFSCTITPKVGDDDLSPVYPYTYTGWTGESQTWSSGGNVAADVDLSLILECGGEYDQLTINVDDITFTKLCSLQAD